MPLKVLMITSGRSAHAERPLKWLLENGCEVAFADGSDPNPQHAGYRFVPYPKGGRRLYRRLLGSQLSIGLEAWAIVPRLWLLGRRLRPDVVHVHWVNRRAYQCWKAGLRPLVLSVWGTDINQHFLPTADPNERRVIGQALAGADLVIVDEPTMAEKCSALAGRKLHTELLHLGVDTRAFRPGYHEAAEQWRRQLGVPPEAKVLLSARVCRWMYNHHLILDAFAQVISRLTAKAVLVIKEYNKLGSRSDSDYGTELRRQAEKLGIAESVRWLPGVPSAQLPELYALSDVVINYPSMDTFPVTFLEAAACERPVISALLPSYRGTFAERCFRMVEPGSVPTLADAIVDMVYASPSEHAGRLSEARRAVERDYDERNYVTRLLELYRGLVARPEGSAGRGGVEQPGL
ncbi:MAG: glycosyltransferase family 4 protein [Planctomycetes bacterium]|nr:glycosyltransferase family 4 protein [Planctomycetota bacterium]